jgi:uncharacterized protein
LANRKQSLVKKTAVILFFLFYSVFAFAQSVNEAVPPRPQPPVLVNDFAGILAADQTSTLEKKLVDFDKESSTQIAVVLVKNLQGYEISEYSLAILRKWGVGQKDKNNGVVLLVSLEDHKLRIETGYGSEGSLPDATCKHIIDEQIVPHLKQNDYYGGLNLGTDAIIKALKGEYKAPPGYGQKHISAGKVLLIIFLVILFLSLISKGGGGGSYMSRRGYRGFTGPTIWWTGGGGGGGSDWGGGGGGFGGFGGGSGGGGGASGSW